MNNFHKIIAFYELISYNEIKKVLMNNENVFKKLRKIRKLTQQELADKLFLDQTTVSKWEVGKAIPDPNTLLKLSDFYKVSVDYLLGKTDLPIELSKLHWNDNIKPIDLYKEFDFSRIPVLGTIAAGNPREAIESGLYDECVYVDTREYGNDIIFGLEISGDSMEPRICEGDIAVIRSCDWVSSGDIAAVRVNGEDTTLKEVKFEQNGMWLIGINPNFKPIYYTAKECEELPVTVIGKLIQVIQRY